MATNIPGSRTGRTGGSPKSSAGSSPAAESAYREQALKLFAWICGRCAREFNGKTLRELTVHHRDHDHRNNPTDGSNWELLCLYCHDNEHMREIEAARAGANSARNEQPPAKHQPFSGLKDLIKPKA